MEVWDAYDRDGQTLGTTLVRGEPIPHGQYHLVCCVIVEHEDGTYLLMKRDASKREWPNVYEASAGGSALQGEDALTAAMRELAEETGITRGTFSPTYTDRGSNTLYRGFVCRTDWPKDAIILQKGETAGYRWVEKEKLLKMAVMRPFVLVLQNGTRKWLEGEPPVIALDGGLIC